MIREATEQIAFNGLLLSCFRAGITVNKRGLIKNRPIQGRMFLNNVIAGVPEELLKCLNKGASAADSFLFKMAFHKTVPVRFHEPVQCNSHDHFILHKGKRFFDLA